MVATICHVSVRTVSKWFDNGHLKGFRIPGSQDRRIPPNHLIEFMEEHGMETLITDELRERASLYR